ncbi:MAG: MBL fold metallo-hydrolase [Acidobacteria bacterium]|nr:MBL fold metallo-hydrolase [Acidobacteriota bacterium]
MQNGENGFRLQLKFWGVRGSIPTPQMENLGHGGNTPCLEVRIPDNEIFIFDAGTGLRNLGAALLKEFKGSRLSAMLFLTHYHWDHIQGLPFFAPLYQAENEFTFHSMASARPARPGERELHVAGVAGILHGQMETPYFPVDFALLPSNRKFIEIDRNPVKCGRLTVHPFPMNHPQGVRGYRIESGGAAIVYASDMEHGHHEFDAVVREYAQNADLLIYDAQYTPEEYPAHRGWGHSTWQEGVRLARETKVKQLVLFHHDPSRTDQAVADLVRQAHQHFENTLAAREGLVVTL